jgi:NAD(P)H-hydrate repair Nnr-like enzyme with NAD(P)H-hydrate dehydratase domain
MLAIVGTIPDSGFSPIRGTLLLQGDCICIQDRTVDIGRGTAALAAAAIKTCETMNISAPIGFFAGDPGNGKGSRLLYEYVIRHLPECLCSAVVFHYILPDVDLCNRVLFAVDKMSPRPLLIADAGFMYVAKMAGQAPAFELFTPDAGELAFLADEEAPHPFYTRGFILQDGLLVEDLIARTYKYGNAARYLLVKGSTDYVAHKDGILARVDQPNIEELEPIGGTGDTITGIASALIAGGMHTGMAAHIAIRTNRIAGHLAKLTPASQVEKIIAQIPKALHTVLREDERTSASFS